jgi:STE24 endopeptidase
LAARLLFVLVAVLALAGPARAAEPFDPQAATQAYLASVSGPQRERSDAYFEGKYWLQLWDFLLVVGVNLGLLASGASRRMRDLAERRVRFGPLQTLVYGLQYFLVSSLLVFPMTLYEGYFREHQYGLSNQTLGAWCSEQLTALAVGLVFGSLAVLCLYGVVRRLPRTWALWGAIVSIALFAFGSLVSPVYVDPLFNEYKRVDDPVVSEPIKAMARAQGVAVEDVWVFDASRQTKRISANVSGIFGTMRIRLNDNLLHRSSMAEIEPVMGHELGHYVLHHGYQAILFFAVVITIGFALLRWAFDRVVRARGAAWGIRGAGDVAGMPLAILILALYFFVLTPVLNTYSRVQEAEADLFGINASGQPDGMAQVHLKLGEYRKLDPTPVEELLFYDHPSGRHRILTAMRWKAEHLAEAEANARRAADADVERGWSPERAAE